MRPDCGAQAAIAPEKLSQGKLSAEEYAFKQEVYKRHVARGVASGRPRIYDLPAADLADIPARRRSCARTLRRRWGGCWPLLAPSWPPTSRRPARTR